VNNKSNYVDLQHLTRLRQPGVEMLIRLGELDTISTIEQASAIQPLIKIARGHRAIQVRISAIKGLRNFKDLRIDKLGEELITDVNPAIRLAAIELFLKCGEEQHAELLERRLKSETVPEIKAKLVETIKQIKPGPEKISASKMVKVAAIQGVSEFGNTLKNRNKCLYR
jgi:HEAT repeat protein